MNKSRVFAAAAAMVAMLCVPPAAFVDEQTRPTPEIVVLELIPTPTAEPTPMPVPTPTPTERPALPDYEYDDADARCISRAIWSCVPIGATYDTKLAFAEVVQNMVADGRYKDTVRYTLLMDTEFPSYDPDAYRSSENNAIAKYAMQSAAHVRLTGDTAYRLTPRTGVRYAFYKDGGRAYITVYDWDWNTVYDSGRGAE